MYRIDIIELLVPLHSERLLLALEWNGASYDRRDYEPISGEARVREHRGAPVRAK